MIPRLIDEISINDVNSLIENGRTEDQSIEYKRTFPGNGEDRSPLLKSVCAFANTRGGDLLLGVSTIEGVPVQVLGIQVASEDATILSLSQLIADGTEPPIRDVAFRFIPNPIGDSVLLIRIKPSWAKPHRLKRGGEFYARGAAGNHPMDIATVRRAIISGEAISERAKAFQAERIAVLLENSGPVRMRHNAVLALHVVPFESFGDDHWRVSPQQWRAEWHNFAPPVRINNLTYEYHADGFVCREINPTESSAAYSLLFRSGILEVAFWIGRIHGEGKIVPSGALEGMLVKSLEHYLPLLERFGVSSPYLVTFSLISAKGHVLTVNNQWEGESRLFDRHVYTFPWVTIRDTATDPAEYLRPSIDALWNAAGHERSFNYTAEDRARNH